MGGQLISLSSICPFAGNIQLPVPGVLYLKILLHVGKLFSVFVGSHSKNYCSELASPLLYIPV